MNASAPISSRSLRFGLRTKILLVVLFSVTVPVLTMGLYLLTKSEEILREKVRENLSFQLLRRTAQVEKWSADRLRELGRWSASFVVFEGVAAVRGGGADERTRRDLKEFLLSLQRYNKVYETLSIVDLEGNVVASTSEDELDAWARETVARRPPEGAAMSPVLHSPKLGRPTLVAFDHIQDQSSRTLGYLVGRLDLRDLTAQLTSRPADGGVAFWLLGPDGRFVVRDGKAIVSARPVAFPFAVGHDARPDALATIGPADLPGVPEELICSVRRLEGPLGGYLVAALPASTAYLSLEESRGRLLAFGVPLVLLVFLLTMLATRRVLLPIRRLSESVVRVSEGDFDVRLPERGNDEISDLTRVFNLMARRVRDGLQRVEEARDALARTNEELTGANERLSHLAITDGLTGLFNHRHFHDVLQPSVALAVAESRPLTLLMIDLDHFKAYNDRFGHSSGDAALRRVADALRRTIRGNDTAFRYGGEELAELLPGCGKADGWEVARKICEAVRSLPVEEGVAGGPITVSIGVAACPEDASGAPELLDAADAAMYAAKWQGRDRVVTAGADESAAATSSGKAPAPAAPR